MFWIEKQLKNNYGNIFSMIIGKLLTVNFQSGIGRSASSCIFGAAHINSSIRLFRFLQLQLGSSAWCRLGQPCRRSSADVNPACRKFPVQFGPHNFRRRISTDLNIPHVMPCRAMQIVKNVTRKYLAFQLDGLSQEDGRADRPREEVRSLQHSQLSWTWLPQADDTLSCTSVCTGICRSHFWYHQTSTVDDAHPGVKKDGPIGIVWKSVRLSKTDVSYA